mmetsp:Transcript_49704/g.124688  ORF Transcript_49704/g.124688 Transcript_49704/m.124688 type:complete len:214 (+) Transcript_49704:711-1352(+)
MNLRLDVYAHGLQFLCCRALEVCGCRAGCPRSGPEGEVAAAAVLVARVVLVLVVAQQKQLVGLVLDVRGGDEAEGRPVCVEEPVAQVVHEDVLHAADVVPLEEEPGEEGAGAVEDLAAHRAPHVRHVLDGAAGKQSQSDDASGAGADDHVEAVDELHRVAPHLLLQLLLQPLQDLQRRDTQHAAPIKHQNPSLPQKRRHGVVGQQPRRAPIYE